MRHFFYILTLLILPLSAVAQSDDDEEDDDELNDTIQPSAVSWRVLLDAETTIGDVGVYGFGINGGINFANDHLFYGVGLGGMYAFREEVTHEEEIKNGKETGATTYETVYDVYGVDKMYVNISMFLRYSVLPKRMFSPVFQFKISKALNERSTSFKSACLGICYNMPDSGHSWTLSVGVCRFDYNISKNRTVKLDYNSLTVVGLGFKF
jgi:hypothetical protein